MIKELQIEKKLIEDKKVLLRRYNYSYVKYFLEEKYNQKVYLSTSRAKENDFYVKRKYKKTDHDRSYLSS